MSHRMILTSVTALFCAGALAATPQAQARDAGPEIETDYARLVGGAGFGYCEMTRTGQRVHVRAQVAGMGAGNIGTAWIFINGMNVGWLDGTVATEGGDAFFSGSFNAPRDAEVKIDIRDHLVSIKSIGNMPDNEMADEMLVRELTTPAAFQMGTCATRFDAGAE